MNLQITEFLDILVRYGNFITMQTNELIDEINNLIAQINRDISGGNKSAEIQNRHELDKLVLILFIKNNQVNANNISVFLNRQNEL